MRTGRQTPTRSLVLPYKATHGQEAIDLYNSSKRTAMEWQSLLIFDILAVNDDGLYTHSRFGYSVPRRNGKNEIIIMRELYGLETGERIIHTAHRTTTTHSAWERLCDRLTDLGTPFKSIKAIGRESIRIAGAGRIDFRTRTSKGGLGEGFDLLVIDEAQEYQDDQESTLSYVVSDSKNPQTLLCGTPPTPSSSGTVFTKFRDTCLAGKSVNAGWAEWSVDEITDPHDVEAWYQTNPSLGNILTERKILDEIRNDDLDFNIQRLGYWNRYSLKSAISQLEWNSLKLETLPKFMGKMFVGIKYGADNTNVSMAIAIKTEDHRIFVECIDCRPIRSGTGWITRFIDGARIQQVVVDGAAGQELLAKAMKDEKLKPPIFPTVKEVIAANAAFTLGVETQKLCHMDQPSLTQVVSNCERRPIGSNGGYGYKSQLSGADIGLMDAVILAYWSAEQFKDRRKQRVSY